ncbi:MAG: hypothetical protein AB1405_01215 [Bdellovibrionota bacterium]
MKKHTIRLFLAGSIALGFAAGPAAATDKTNQVFFRGAYSRLNDGRGGEVFTDAGGATTFNGKEGGFSVAAGLDVGLMPGEEWGGNPLLGEIFLEYSRFSNERVTTATSVLLGAPATDRVAISALNVTVAPKLRFDSMGQVRPWVIPAGLSFLVNSPPSNNTTYLDVGVHFGAGVDVTLAERLSVGADVRYTHGLEQADTFTRYFSTGAYLGINF